MVVVVEATLSTGPSDLYKDRQGDWGGEERTAAPKTSGSSFALYVSRGRDARTGIVATQEKCAPEDVTRRNSRQDEAPWFVH